MNVIDFGIGVALGQVMYAIWCFAVRVVEGR